MDKNLAFRKPNSDNILGKKNTCHCLWRWI